MWYLPLVGACCLATNFCPEKVKSTMSTLIEVAKGIKELRTSLKGHPKSDWLAQFQLFHTHTEHSFTEFFLDDILWLLSLLDTTEKTNTAQFSWMTFCDLSLLDTMEKLTLHSFSEFYSHLSTLLVIFILCTKSLVLKFFS